MHQLADPAAWPTLADALRAWLPRQRWFAGKDRTVVAVDVLDAVVLTGPGTVVDVLVAVSYAEGGTEHYQVPLAAATSTHVPGEPVTTVDGRPVVDAVGVDTAVRTLAQRMVTTAAQQTVRGDTVAGRVPERAPATGSGGDGALDELPPPRPLEAEQSNSSVVFGDAFIFKLFRRLESGTNPDVEITRALTEQGFPHVPAQRAALELCGHGRDGHHGTTAAGGTADDEGEPHGTALAVLSDFVPGGQQGWELATEEVARLAEGRQSEPDRSLQRVLGDLGDVTARLHRTLARAFGSREADSADVVAWSTEMSAQAQRVLDTAARHVPEAAAPVLGRRAELLDRLERLASQAQGGPLLRIHGDLHLGQVLRDRTGVWQILDFEGEPSRSLAQRRALNAPLRDVAGMLRSFDYAAATGAAPDGNLPAAVTTWRDGARAAFLDAYLGVATREGLVAGDAGVRHGQLAAFELDKAVYELGYELANRPAWLHIPVNGILRVLDTPEPGT